MRHRVVRRLLVFALTAWAIWVSLAIYFSPALPESKRGVAAGLFVMAALLCLVPGRLRRARMSAFTCALVAFSLWWRTIEPTGVGPWDPRVAVLPWAEIDGDLVTIHDIRNFDYRRSGEMIPGYYTRTFDLEELSSVDLFAVYWMGEAVAHVIVSFGFADRDYVAFSIETRKRAGQEYSPISGLFRSYELIYVAADERDVIRYRTTYENPPEDVYLYRLPMLAENAKRFFLTYVERVNELYREPEFYNTLTTNCTTNVLIQARGIRPALPLDWRILFSGYFPDYLYDLAPERFELPLSELKRRGYTNERSEAADGEADFSRGIRQGVPGGALVRDPSR